MADDIVSTIPLNVKLIHRLYVMAEPLEAGKFLYCDDTTEGFFDENKITRICFGKIETIDLIANIPEVTDDYIGSFILVKEDLSVRYASSELKWTIVSTRDQMTSILGGIERFTPHNLIKNGRLIAPRTLVSCVYDAYGTPISESLNYLSDYVDMIQTEGLNADRITSGVLDPARIPKEAMMDFLIVPDAEHRFQLTKDQVQNGDVIQQEDNSEMYFVVDDTKLDSEEGYRHFTVGSIPWNAVVNRPLSITIGNGAVGTASLDTNNTLNSQKIKLLVNLNMDYADNGILAIERGGTGNQIGEAQYINHTNESIEELHIAGFRSNNKIASSDVVTVKDGILYAPVIKATDSTAETNFDNLSADKVSLNKNNGSKSITVYDNSSNPYNVYKYYNSSNVFGDSKANTYVYGSNTVIKGTNSVKIQIGDESNSSHNITLTKEKTAISNPLQITNKLTINSDDNGSLSYEGIKTLYSSSATTNSKGLSTIIFNQSDSSSNGLILNSNNNIVIRKSSTNIAEVTDKGLYINGLVSSNGDLHLKGSAYIEGSIYGNCKQAENADTLDGYHADYFMKNDGSNNTKPPVVVSTDEPTGRTNCLWINANNGIANYWNGSTWTPISNTWKT